MPNAKQELYQKIDQLRFDLGLPVENYPINMLDVFNVSRTNVVYRDYETNGFCAAAFAGPIRDMVLLNSRRTEAERNFDGGHEYVHLHLHREMNGGIFQCSTRCQDSFTEWQANEGSAQLLIPYQDFIPRFCRHVFQSPFRNANDPLALLADYYNVSAQVSRLLARAG